MTDSPILSYKRPSTASSKQISNPPSHPSSPLPNSQINSPKIPPSNPTSRQVLSRRKALQDFYNIHHQEITGYDDDEKKQTLDGSTEELKEVSFNNPDEFSKFVKSTSIEDILKLRNSITNKQNSHDLAKKSIIYDNYYELIKLSQILGDLSKPKPPPKDDSLDSFKIFTDTDTETKTKTKEIEDDYLDSVFNDLTSFIERDVSRFNSDFDSVISSLRDDFEDDNDSSASVKGMVEPSTTKTFPQNINKIQLVKEINALLNIDSNNVDKTLKDTILADIQKILKNLSKKYDELLILQLNELKSKFT